jgi:hypothetical protein
VTKTKITGSGQVLQAHARRPSVRRTLSPRRRLRSGLRKRGGEGEREGEGKRGRGGGGGGGLGGG